MSYAINNLPSCITIGRETETAVTEIRIDCTEWLDRWPDMDVSVIVRTGRGAIYIPANLTMEGKTLVWCVDDVDTSILNKSTMEITGIAPDRHKLSEKVDILVDERLAGTTGETPDPMKPWVDRVIEAANTVGDARDDAVSAKDEAFDSANVAYKAAFDARESEKNAHASEQEAAQSANIAKDAEENTRATLVTVNGLAEYAKSSAEMAKESEEKSLQNANNAGTYATSAKESEIIARESGETAKTSAQSAQTSAGSAAESANQAKRSEEAAKGYADNTGEYARIATEKAQKATEQANSAGVSATSAEESANRASASEQNAATSAQEAKSSADSTKGYSESANEAAVNASDSARKAQVSAENAAASANNAEASKASAQVSAENARVSSQNAEDALQELRDKITSGEFKGEPGEPGKDAVVDATLTQSGQAADAKATGDVVSQLKDDLAGIWLEHSENLYDPALQTPDTISPFFWNGGPTTITSYHCTAPIPVEPNTTYTIGIVPALDHPHYGMISKPWHNASVGVLFFDIDNRNITQITDQTFTTPSNCVYIRFNYLLGNVAGGINLDTLNSRCMMVKGDVCPESYIPYETRDLKKEIKELLGRNLIDETTLRDTIGSINPPIYYKIDGDNIYVVSKYGNNKDIVVHLNKRGANNIFDFSYLSTIENEYKNPSSNIAGATSFIGFGTDIHAPFVFDAVDNADGDGTATNYTGGNHAYNGVASGRTTSIKFYINGKETDNGEGYCNFVEIKWINRIQAKNTFKADGSGRECLEERHSLIFDGNEWKTHVEIVPLENIIMHAWYGFQMYGTHRDDLYPKIRYVGGLNRTENIAKEGTKCGNNKATKFIIYGETHMAEVEIDPTYDLGDRSLFNGSDNAIYSSTAGKVYFYIINNKTQMETGNSYYLRGAYRFRPVQ